MQKSLDFHSLESSIKSGTRFLILNADDMGMSRGVTDGIVESCLQGLTTDISMIVTMPDSRRAAGIALEEGLNVGVHLDLTRQKRERVVGRPLLGAEVPSLIDEEGYFHGSGELRKRIQAGAIDLGQVEAELTAQVDQAIEWGLDLSHIDSNEGLHNYYPEILRMVLKMAREHDLPVRWPNPIHLDWLRPEGVLTTDHLHYTFYDVPAEDKWKAFTGRLDGMQPGITEFIFHPARADAETKALTAYDRREAELKLLTDPRLPGELEEREIKPLSFREIRERQRDMRSRGAGLLRAGCARIKITPPFRTQMGGYFDRLGLSEGVHDDLHARALFLSSGYRSALIVSVEVLYVDRDFVEDVRREISKSTGICEEQIMIFATHTHSGPEGHTKLASLLGFFPNPSLRKFLAERISCCALTAFNGARAARVGSASVPVPDMSSNRQKEGGPIDRELRVLRVEGSGGELMGALVNFTAHPVIMNSRNLEFSSDYPGHAMGVLEGVFGGDSVCLFANGACGNVTIRRSGSSFSEVKRVGEMLAGHALRALSDVQTTEEVAIGSSCSTIPLQLRDLPSVGEAKAELRELESRTPRDAGEAKALRKRLAKASGTLALAEKAEYIRSFLGDQVQTQLQTVAINDSLLLGIPAELFVEYALTLKEDLGESRAFIIGYCNDIVGYVVTPDAAREGGYEAGATLLDEGTGKAIVDGIRRMALGS